MTGNTNNFIWARAEGESLKAIQALWVEKETKYSARELFDAIRLLGLDTGVVQVKSYPNGKNLATEIVNAVYTDPVRDVFYIRVPVDYKGRTPVPIGAVPLNETETTEMMDRLFSGNWGDGNAERLQIEGVEQTDMPVAVPGDYKPAKFFARQSSPPMKPFEP